MTKIAGLLQKTTKFLKIIFGTEVYEGGAGVFGHERSK